MRKIGVILLLLALLPAIPASGQAAPVAAARSRALVFAPVLAPGACGRAPLSGEILGDRFSLRAPISALATGNAMYDVLLHHLPVKEVALDGRLLRLARRAGNFRFYRAWGVVSLNARPSFEVPLLVKLSRFRNESTFDTTLRVPLAPFGVHTLSGGPPGSLAVGLRAYFPD